VNPYKWMKMMVMMMMIMRMTLMMMPMRLLRIPPSLPLSHVITLSSLQRPYTYTGDICIAVNPYKWMADLYSDEQRERYLGGERAALPPHVYGMSSTAYRLASLRTSGHERGIRFPPLSARVLIVII
jgi:hypothetical protein